MNSQIDITDAFQDLERSIELRA
jgi:hypothetical protein